MVISNNKLFLLLHILFFLMPIFKINCIEVKVDYETEIPPFGNVLLSGNVDIENKKFTLSGTKNETFDLGFLKISNPLIGLSTQKEFSANATVNILGEKALLEIIKYIPNKIAIYKIDPTKKLIFPITPWTDIDIDSFIFLIKKDLYELQTNIKIFNQDAILKFGKKRAVIQPVQPSIPQNITPPPNIQTPEAQKILPQVTPDNYAEFSIKNLKPSDIIKNTVFDAIELQNASFKIDDPFTKGKDHPITIKCVANLKKLNIGLPIDLSKIESEIKLNKTTGFTLESKLKDLTISNNINLKQTNLTIIIPPTIKTQPIKQPEQTPQTPGPTNENTPTETPTEEIKPEIQPTAIVPKTVKKPSIFLSGKADLNLPILGELNSDFLAEYNNGIFTFKISIDPRKKINIANIGTFEKCTLILSQTGNFEIQGEINLVDINWIGTLKFSKATTPTTKTEIPQTPNDQQPPQSEQISTQQPKSTFQTGGYTVEFSAIAKKEIFPFKNIAGLKEIAQLKNIKISNPGLSINTDKTFSILGQSELLGFKSNVTLEISNLGLTFKAFPPKGWKISDAIKPLEGTFFDKIDLSKTQIVISSFPHIDPKLNINLSKGINLAAVTNLADKTFTNAKNLIKGLGNQSLNLFGSLGSLKDTKLAVTLPFKEIKLSDKAFLENISFFFTGSNLGPSMGLKTQIKIIPTQDDDPLLFTGAASIDMAKSGVILSGSMLGNWENPLGLDGITLSNIGCEVSLPVLTNIGIAGSLIFDEKKAVSMATKYSTDGKIVLMGKYTGELLLEDILSIPAKANPNFDIKSFKKNFPDLGFYDSEFRFAPLPTKIGEIIIEPGISLKSHMKFFNDKEAFVNIGLGSTGLIAQGSMSEFELGPIKISGYGLDGEYNTKDDGPTIDFSITPETQHFMLSGLVDIRLASGQGDIYIGRDGVDIYLSAGLFDDLFEVNYKLKSVKKDGHLDFDFSAALSNKLYDYLSQNIVKNLTIFKGEAKTKIESAINNLEKTDIKIKKINKDIKKKNKEIEKLNKQYNQIAAAEEYYDI
ncbi:hypothetical protein KJ644_00880 [Candidatus Dependentiae bacterium]|nr:hypothetical protein [Candidatus Dependentiae bacterium]MBU4387007.1 hypothetical protein [Candidatus Dependentiae bacterium]MCG2756666.1 hypothetical protein [Candidatus Dependentiae bacterium]